MHPLKQKQTIHLEKRGHQDLADKVNEIVNHINSEKEKDKYFKSPQTEKEYAGATLLGLIEHFEDLEEDGANIPPYIYRNIRKFGKKNNLPPFNNK